MCGISSVTSCHFLASARKKPPPWDAQNCRFCDGTDGQRQQLIFIKQKPTHFHTCLPRCQSVHKCSWNEETGTPSNLSLSSKRRHALHKNHVLAGPVQGLFAAYRVAFHGGQRNAPKAAKYLQRVNEYGNKIDNNNRHIIMIIHQ